MCTWEKVKYFFREQNSFPILDFREYEIERERECVCVCERERGGLGI